MKKTQSSENIGGLGPRQILEDVVTLSEIATHLKMTPAQVRELIRKRCARPIPVLRAGRHLRFSLNSVADWLVQKKP